jgi:hypothetical protein
VNECIAERDGHGKHLNDIIFYVYNVIYFFCQIDNVPGMGLMIFQSPCKCVLFIYLLFIATVSYFLQITFSFPFTFIGFVLEI